MRPFATLLAFLGVVPVLMAFTSNMGFWRAPEAPACTGDTVGGYCWFISGDGQTCNAVCTGHGAACVAAGITWGWNATNCLAIGNAVTGASSQGGAAGSNNIGCWKNPGGNIVHQDITAATCAGAFGGNKRYCACTY